MGRREIFDHIELQLNLLVSRINKRGSLNLLELNIHSENFFADLINLLFNYKLKNVSSIKSNMEGIDLIDIKNKICAQVSATATKSKIEETLDKKY